MLFRLARPALFTLDSETGHRLAIAGLKALPTRGARSSLAQPGATQIEVAGLTFPNPVGVAAGFDKDAEVPDALLGLGFGFTEVGSITPRPQEGNPKPRLFRLVEDDAVINRMGFNIVCVSGAEARLKACAGKTGILGFNIGAIKYSDVRIADYATMARIMTPYARYLAVNVSSPNTPGLRALQDESALTQLIDGVIDARDAVAGSTPPPVFLKVAPDLEPADVDAIARIAIDKKLGAHHAGEVGGLSGAPLRELALQRVRDFRSATGGAIPLVGVGGIATADHAWERIKAGASLVQLYSAMVYEGPGLGARIAKGIERLMRRDGFSSVAEAVGSE